MSYKRCYAKIELGNIAKNVESVRNIISEETMIMAVVKADAYGHGATIVSDYLQDKVDFFGVSNVNEAIELRQANISKPILILGSTMADEICDVVKNNITPAVYCYNTAKLISDEAAAQNKNVKIHIKVDTGMSRIGFEPSESSVNEILNISKLPNISIEGIFSHFAKSDYSDKAYALEQKNTFDDFCASLEAKGLSFKIKHLSNSAATMEMDANYNMVRMGIMLYGLYPSDEINRGFVLYPSMQLLSRITHIKEVPSGQGISYGHIYVTDRQTRIATVSIGYADGYSRCLSNSFYVLVNGKKCKILGRICMDQMMIDVTDVECCVGDEVVLFGQSRDEFLSVEELSEAAGSFNYEFVCGVSRRVTRVYYENGQFLKTVNYLMSK